MHEWEVLQIFKGKQEYNTACLLDINKFVARVYSSVQFVHKSNKVGLGTQLAQSVT